VSLEEQGERLRVLLEDTGLLLHESQEPFVRAYCQDCMSLFQKCLVRLSKQMQEDAEAEDRIMERDL
jgi:hypothetical protein